MEPLIVEAAQIALKNGTTPDTQIPSPTVYDLPTGGTMQNFGGEKCGNGVTDTLKDALAISCNTAFAQLGVSLGTDAVRNEAQLFGIDDQSWSMPLNDCESWVFRRIFSTCSTQWRPAAIGPW